MGGLREREEGREVNPRVEIVFSFPYFPLLFRPKTGREERVATAVTVGLQMCSRVRGRAYTQQQPVCTVRSLLTQIWLMYFWPSIKQSRGRR